MFKQLSCISIHYADLAPNNISLAGQHRGERHTGMNSVGRMHVGDRSHAFPGQ